MSWPPGTKIGPYEIVAPLGAGGMGEVHRARETRLDRDVAIKVITAAQAGDEQLRLRFQREAKAISALNHPHICTLYDVGEHEGAPYLVMEYRPILRTCTSKLERQPAGLEVPLHTDCPDSKNLH